jgi:hypothetical protein
MPRRHTLTRTLGAALAIAALTAPSAVARPGGPASPAAADAAAKSQQVQDLRRLKAGNSIRTSSLAGTTSDTSADGKGPVYWSYEYEAGDPQAARSLHPDDGTPWTAIAGGIAGACLLFGGAGALAGRARLRAGRARTAA